MTFKNGHFYFKLYRIVVVTVVVIFFAFLIFIPGIKTSRVDTHGFSQNLFVYEDRVYLADYFAGLPVIDISDRDNPNAIGFVFTNGSTTMDVSISGDHLFVADGNIGLGIINISEPEKPGIPIYVDTLGNAVKIFVDGDIAYTVYDFSFMDIQGVMIHYRGVAIVDIADLNNPRLLLNTYTKELAMDIFVSDGFLYIVDYSKGLAVINVTDPENPGNPLFTEISGNALDVFISGSYAYVACSYEGLAIIDISDPMNPDEPIYVDTAGEALGIFVSENTAYIADYSKGLAIIDVTDPLNPGDPVYVDTEGSGLGVFISENYAYIADGFAGLVVVDLSNISYEIEIYNRELFILLVGLIISAPFALMTELIFLYGWMKEKKRVQKKLTEKITKFVSSLFSEALNGILRGACIGAITGLIIGTSRFIPGSLINASNHNIWLEISELMIIGALIGAVVETYITPTLRGVLFEISIGLLIGGVIGGILGARMGLEEFLRGLLAGMIMGVFGGIIFVIVAMKIKVQINIRKGIRQTINNLKDQLPSIDDAANSAYINRNYKKFIQFKYLSIDTLIEMLYLEHFKIRPADPKKYREIFHELEEIYNTSLADEKKISIWVQMYKEVIYRDYQVKMEELDEFLGFYDELNQKLKVLIKK